MKRGKKRTTGSTHKPVVLFLARCVLYWAAALFLVSRVPAVEEGGIELTLRTLQLAFGAFGQKVERMGSALFAAGTSVEIVSECSPHMAFLIFGAVVLAFPASWRQRITGLLLGALVIHLFNTIRILTLIWVLAVKRPWFDFIHVYLWQTGTILIVFATFAIWIATLGRRKAPEPARA
jgi:exosortase/archaeosortase family protein